MFTKTSDGNSRARPGAAAAAEPSPPRRRSRHSSVAAEFFRELFVPPQQAYPPATSSCIESVGHISDGDAASSAGDSAGWMRPQSEAEVRQKERRLLRLKAERRSSLNLPPAEAPVFTTMAPPKRKEIDLDSGVYVSPNLAGMAGDALPSLVRAIKQDERRKRAERRFAPGEGDDDPAPCCQKINPLRRPRAYLFALTCVYVFWYAGAFFGYGPMQLMLERRGAFSYLCDDADLPEGAIDTDETPTTTTATTTCPEQSAMLLNVQFVAQLTMIASPLLGAWCDKNGPAEVAGGLFLSGSVGILLLAIATSNLGIDWLLFPSFLCSGLMAQIAGLMTVQTGLIFTKPRSVNRAISALNALYDAGAITYLILWYIDTHTVLTLPTLSALNLAFFVSVVGSAVKAWFKITDAKGEVAESESRRLKNESKREEWDDEECKEEINDDVTHISHTKQTHMVMDVPDGAYAMNDSESSEKSSPRQKLISWRDELSVVSEEDGENEEAVPKPRSALEIPEASAPDLGEGDKEGDEKGDEKQTSTTPSPESKKASVTFGNFGNDEDFIEEPAQASSGPRQYILISSRPALDQLRSSQFLYLAAFFAFHHSRNTWTLTTTRDFLAYLGDDATGNKYLAIFTLLTPASVLGLPLVDKIVHKGGYVAGLHVVNALAIGQGIIVVSSDNLNVQIVGFLLYSFYRCFLFSVCFSCLPSFLDGIVLGKGYGVLIFSGGVLSLMNIPLSNAAVQKLGGNFFIPNLIYTVLCVPCIFFIWNLHQGFKREAAEKSRIVEMESNEMMPRESIGDNTNDSDDVAEEVER